MKLEYVVTPSFLLHHFLFLLRNQSLRQSVIKGMILPGLAEVVPLGDQRFVHEDVVFRTLGAPLHLFRVGFQHCIE